jgi:arsenate reductase
LRRDDWPLRDPKGLPQDEVRAIRDEVKSRVQSLIEAEGVGGQNTSQ